jgi:hypothetical protein
MEVHWQRQKGKTLETFNRKKKKKKAKRVAHVMSWSRFQKNLTLYTYNYYMYAKWTLVYAPTSALVYIKYKDI